MKIKTKLTLSIGLLFLLVLVLGTVGIVYINTLKADTENILRANYNTVVYSRNMLMALEDTEGGMVTEFETNLSKQEENVTEPGEREVTQVLRKYFSHYVNNHDTLALKMVKENIFQLMSMNMLAIERKTDLAKENANNATLWIAISGTLCFVIAFTLLVNIPAYIANPIRELTESIKEIANKNYAERVHFEANDEFGDLARSFNSMAEKLEEYINSSLAKLMNEKKRIETLINSMHDPVIGLDENFRVLFANSEAVKITGTTLGELLGKDAKELALRNDLIRMLIRDLHYSVEAETSIKAPPLKIFYEGKEGYFDKETLHISIVPAGEQERKWIGYVIILNNVTRYQELDSAKTNFIATVSHEFKTPISSIKMSVQLLENEQVGSLNAEQKGLVAHIRDDAARLLTITTELLNMTQVESGNLRLAMQPSDCVEILKNAIEATAIQAAEKQVRIESAIEDDLPPVMADGEKTVWVLTNILSNAIRYSHENSTVYASIIYRDEKVMYSIRDTGQGIDPRYKDKIFDRYFRIPGSKKEGTGLGLAICKEFIEAQGGLISLESDYGSGSTFNVALPASRSSQVR